MNARIPILQGFKALFVLAIGACTYSQPTTGEPPEETSGSGGMPGASSTSSSSGLGLASGTSSSSSGDAGSTSSSSASSSGIPMPMPNKVQCGSDAQCSAGAVTNDGCCIFEGTYTCGKNISCQGTFFYCDELADCPVGVGLACCLDPNGAKDANCRPATTCIGPLIPICRTIADCPAPMENCDYTKFGTIGECKP